MRSRTRMERSSSSDGDSGVLGSDHLQTHRSATPCERDLYAPHRRRGRHRLCRRRVVDAIYQVETFATRVSRTSISSWSSPMALPPKQNPLDPWPTGATSSRTPASSSRSRSHQISGTMCFSTGIAIFTARTGLVEGSGDSGRSSARGTDRSRVPREERRRPLRPAHLPHAESPGSPAAPEGPAARPRLSSG